VKLPVGSEVESVMFISPDLAAETELEGEVDGGRLRFELPEFSVYGVARVLLK
jgi:hypothetical protein